MIWTDTLKELSLLINTSVEDNMIYYNKSSIVENWLGFPPAEDSEIEKKEIELNMTLPKSYKDFLKASNGFRQISLIYR